MKKILPLLLLLTLFSCNKVAQIYLDKGIEKDRSFNYQGAIEDYTTAIGIDPNISYAYAHRGDAYYSLHEYNKAILDYKRAIQLEPTVPDYYRKKGLANIHLDLLGSIIDNTEAIKLYPEFVEAYNNRGYAKIKLGYYQDGIKDCNTALTLNPNLAQPKNNITYAELMLNGKVIQAKQFHDTAFPTYMIEFPTYYITSK